MKARSRTRRGNLARGSHSGIVLVLVLVVVALLALAGLAFAELMIAERKASQLSGRQVQARELAASGVEAARSFLAHDQQTQDQDGGSYDNPGCFQGVLVLDEELARDRGRFTLVAPRLEDRAASGFRYGLEDESTKINLRTLIKQGGNDARKVLMGLPGMTESTADAILDWIDEDDTPREFGAESEYYGTLTPACKPRNGPPATIEELLLVRGVTPQLLLGVDAGSLARMGAADPDVGTPEVAIVEDGTMDHGWAAYLTLHSAEQSLRADGTPKIDLNQSDMKTLYEALAQEFDQSWATFIVAYRQNGPADSGNSGKGGGASKPGGSSGKSSGPSELDLTKSGKTKLTSVLDLIGAKTKTNASDSATLPSPFTEDSGAMSTYLPKLMDATTVSSDPVPGRININQASRVVLMCIPGMTSDIVDQVISKRMPESDTTNPDRRYETWLLTEGVVPLKTMKTLMPWINAGGSVYRVQAIGHFESGGPAARIEAVLDAGKQPASILFWKEVSSLGRGYPQELLEGGRP
jgi:hypothetical protein